MVTSLKPGDRPGRLFYLEVNMAEYQRNDKDCLNCCLSTLLDIEYDTLPKFWELYPNENDSDDLLFRVEFDKWLASKGYFRIMCDCGFVPKKIKVPYISLEEIDCIGILKKQNRFYSHCVILTITKNKIEIAFDPKKNSDYDLLDIVSLEFIIKNNGR